MTGARLSMGFVVVALLLLGGGAVTSAATAVGPTTLIATDDGYVSSSRPTSGFGTTDRLRVAASPTLRSYLKFDLSSIHGTVTGAVLKLTVASPSDVGFDVREVADFSWSERTLKYVNAPRFSRSIGVSNGPVAPKRVISLDVTASVKAGIRSFALVNRPGSSAFSMLSSENRKLTARPRLVIIQKKKTKGPGTGPPSYPSSPSSPVTPAPPASAVPAPPVAPTTNPSSGSPASSKGPCGTVTAPPSRVDHVIWIWMENKPFDAVIGSPLAPFKTQLAAACGLATNYHAITHPSLPNYIAATSGGQQGVVDNDPPSAHPLDVPSIFSQVKAVGKTWRSYQESAPGNCPLGSSGQYAVKHDPAPYYTGIRSDCANWDVPMGTTTSGNFITDLTGGTLPAFSFVTPDLCNDTHDCPIWTGDAWLESWFAKIVASPTYLAGRTVIFVTWDEDDGSVPNRVPLIVVNPSTPAGTQSGTFFDHYSLLKTTEQLLGITTFLGHAGDAGTSSMVSAFNLG